MKKLTLKFRGTREYDLLPDFGNLEQNLSDNVQVRKMNCQIFWNHRFLYQYTPLLQSSNGSDLNYS